jgi:hypothetical protein
MHIYFETKTLEVVGKGFEETIFIHPLPPSPSSSTLD